MATQNSYQCAIDLGGVADRFVDVNGDGKIVLASDGAIVLGVLKGAGGAAGAWVSVVESGVAFVEAAGAVAAGRMIASDANGRARAAQTGDYAAGRLTEDAAAAGDQVGATIEHLGDVLRPLAADGSPIVTAAGPTASDGSPMTTPAQFPAGMRVLFTGRGDSLGDDAADPERYAGQSFGLQTSAVGEAALEVRFSADIWTTGGTLLWTGGGFGDWFDYRVTGPASPATQNVGAGAWAKLAVGGGLSMLVPPGTPGAGGADWDLDLAEKINARSPITKVVPIPSPRRAGFFDYDGATGAVVASTPGAGGFCVYDGAVPLGRMAVEKPITLSEGSASLLMGAVPARRMLPHWIHRAAINNAAAKTLAVSWELVTARANPA